jgi:hypothetical protein
VAYKIFRNSIKENTQVVSSGLERIQDNAPKAASQKGSRQQQHPRLQRSRPESRLRRYSRRIKREERGSWRRRRRRRKE